MYCSSPGQYHLCSEAWWWQPWGCLTITGAGRLVRIEGKVKAAKYRDILDINL